MDWEHRMTSLTDSLIRSDTAAFVGMLEEILPAWEGNCVSSPEAEQLLRLIANSSNVLHLIDDQLIRRRVIMSISAICVFLSDNPSFRGSVGETWAGLCDNLLTHWDKINLCDLLNDFDSSRFVFRMSGLNEVLCLRLVSGLIAKSPQYLISSIHFVAISDSLIPLLSKDPSGLLSDLLVQKFIPPYMSPDLLHAARVLEIVQKMNKHVSRRISKYIGYRIFNHGDLNVLLGTLLFLGEADIEQKYRSVNNGLVKALIAANASFSGLSKGPSVADPLAHLLVADSVWIFSSLPAVDPSAVQASLIKYAFGIGSLLSLAPPGLTEKYGEWAERNADLFLAVMKGASSEWETLSKILVEKIPFDKFFASKITRKIIVPNETFPSLKNWQYFLEANSIIDFLKNHPALISEAVSKMPGNLGFFVKKFADNRTLLANLSPNELDLVVPFMENDEAVVLEFMTPSAVLLCLVKQGVPVSSTLIDKYLTEIKFSLKKFQNSQINKYLSFEQRMDIVGQMPQFRCRL